jgi:hypothetical protein
MRISTDHALFLSCTRKTIQSCLLAVVGLAFVALPPFSQAKRLAVIDIDSLPESAKTELALRIRRIEVNGLTMKEALDSIAAAADKWLWAHRHPYLDVHFRYSREAEYIRRGIRPDHYRFRDPRVTLRATNLTLAEVFNKLCAQSGWSYDRNSAGNITFTDDSHLFQRK